MSTHIPPSPHPSGTHGAASPAKKPEKPERPSYAAGRAIKEKQQGAAVPAATPVSGTERLRAAAAGVDPLTGIPKTENGRVDVRQIVEALLADLSARRARIYDRVGEGIRQIWNDVEAEAHKGMVSEDVIDHLQRLIRILEEQEKKLNEISPA